MVLSAGEGSCQYQCTLPAAWLTLSRRKELEIRRSKGAALLPTAALFNWGGAKLRLIFVQMDLEHCTGRDYTKQLIGVFKNSLLKFSSEVSRSSELLIHSFSPGMSITDHCLAKTLLLAEQSDHSPESFGLKTSQPVISSTDSSSRALELHLCRHWKKAVTDHALFLRSSFALT